MRFPCSLCRFSENRAVVSGDIRVIAICHINLFILLVFNCFDCHSHNVLYQTSVGYVKDVSEPLVVLLRRVLITRCKSHHDRSISSLMRWWSPCQAGHLSVQRFLEQLKSGYMHVLRPTMESEQVTNQIKHSIKLEQDKLPQHSRLIHLIFSHVSRPTHFLSEIVLMFSRQSCLTAFAHLSFEHNGKDL